MTGGHRGGSAPAERDVTDLKRKLGFALVLSTLALGVARLFLRRWQLATAVEPNTGLLTPGQPATAALIAVCVLAAAVLGALAWALLRGEAPKGYLANLAAPNLAVGVLTLLAGALLFGAGVLGIRDYLLHLNERVVRLVLAICLVPTGVCVGLIGLLGQQRAEARGRFHGALAVPGYCACMWLVSSFQGHTANPNVMEYAFLLVGVSCVIIACYAAASFSFEKPRPILCGFFAAMGVVLMMVAAADRPRGMDLLTLLGFEGYLLAQLLCLVACRVAPPQLEKWTPPPAKKEADGKTKDAEASEEAPERQDQPRGEEDE